MKNTFYRINLFLVAILFFPIIASAEVGEVFNIDSTFNAGSSQQYQVNADLKNTFSLMDIYIENDFWESKDWADKNKINNILFDLNLEFEKKIYPQLTNAFGGIKENDNDELKKISILFYPMKDDARGYVRNIDAYNKIINPSSNERNIIYLNSKYINEGMLPEILAHEFMHLIQLNQKELKKGVTEQVWLNEARSEYAITFLGYNSKDESYLDKRVKDFLLRPSTPLLEWENTTYDYGAVNMFIHYLVEQHGIEILIDSLNSDKVGIESINEALKKNDYDNSFAEVFRDWSIAVYLNDCSVDKKYCYDNSKLKNVRILTNSAYMPFSRESSVSMNQSIRNWSSNWQRFVGINGNFKMEIEVPENCNFDISYIYKDINEKTHVSSVYVENGRKKEINIPSLRENISPVIFIFSVKGTELEKTIKNPFFVYSITASITSENANEQEIISEPEIKIPFEIDKPLDEMNREELLRVLIRVIVYLLSQGKLVI
jgi:hypothetical protein